MADTAQTVAVPAAFGAQFKTDIDWAYDTERQQHVDSPT
ncbi:hypothetical protein ACVWWN_004970 [Mycobacterium sp. URHB0021]